MEDLYMGKASTQKTPKDKEISIPTCTSSEHFGQKGSGFNRVTGSSGFLQATLC